MAARCAHRSFRSRLHQLQVWASGLLLAAPASDARTGSVDERSIVQREGERQDEGRAATGRRPCLRGATVRLCHGEDDRETEARKARERSRLRYG